MKNFKICALFSLGILCYAQERQIGNPCTPRETCGDCIAANPECAWCSEEDFHHYGKRCDFIWNLLRHCSEDKIIAPAQITMVKLKDEELGKEGVKDEIHLTPQEIGVKLRPESPIILNVKFKQAQDIPVDLYLLTDLSNPMKDEKDKVDELAALLSEEMVKITQNFRIGLGSFVGKAIMNYVDTEHGKQKLPCTGCVASYGFHNHMSLTVDTSNFVHHVQDARVSGNLNNPEGVLGAIMQAVACKDEVGWREKSKKILVFTSNSGFRYAGDGKNPSGWIEKSKQILASSSKNFFDYIYYPRQLGEILKPNDGLCHLDPLDYYTENIYQDHPSLSQISHKIDENKVNIIFAVTDEQVPEYEKLSSLLEGSSVVKLGNDSSNIIHLIRNQYDEITSAVEMKDNAGRNIQVTYYSTCFGDKKEKKNICKGLIAGSNVTFEVDLEVISCPKDPRDWIQTFQIYPVGVDEALTVDLEMTCDCDCGKPWNEEKNSIKCSGNGTYKCGICSCNNNRFGQKCECDTNGWTYDDRSCHFENDTIQCSGRGSCVCGVCDCHQRQSRKQKIYGEFCECDNYSCDRSNGEICSGPDNGICDCGKCKCKEGWKGSDCSCSDSIEQCISPENGKICSDHGDCECNECKCHELDGERYSGLFCESGPTCPLRCDAFRDCVECQIFPDDNAVPAENCNACTFITIGVDKVEAEDDSETLCVVRDDRDGRITFKYKLDADYQPVVFAKRTKD